MFCRSDTHARLQTALSGASGHPRAALLLGRTSSATARTEAMASCRPPRADGVRDKVHLDGEPLALAWRKAGERSSAHRAEAGIHLDRGLDMHAPRMTLKAILVTTVTVLCWAHANPTRAADSDIARERNGSIAQAAVVGTFSASDATAALRKRGAGDNLVVNGGFSQQPNPLAFWTNAPGAFATWISEGANGTQGSVHLRFLPPISTGVARRGAIYYTGLSQCVSIARSGRYLLSGFARVSEVASASSFPGLGWTLRFNGPNCTGPAVSSGRVGFSRSTSWTASSIAAIDIGPEDWTAATTIEISVQVGDSSTTSIEPVEALLDEISMVEGPLFEDGFEE